MKKKLQESAENYLENILILRLQQNQVRSIDLANAMRFSKPSVSRAVHLLEDNGLLHIDQEGLLHLTEQGEALAVRIYQRHLVLLAWFESLGVSPRTAARDACRIEHIISEETFEAIHQRLEEQGVLHPEANTESLAAWHEAMIEVSDEAVSELALNQHHDE